MISYKNHHFHLKMLFVTSRCGSVSNSSQVLTRAPEIAQFPLITFCLLLLLLFYYSLSSHVAADSWISWVFKER